MQPYMVYQLKRFAVPPSCPINLNMSLTLS